MIPNTTKIAPGPTNNRVVRGALESFMVLGVVVVSSELLGASFASLNQPATFSLDNAPDSALRMSCGMALTIGAAMLCELSRLMAIVLFHWKASARTKRTCAAIIAVMGGLVLTGALMATRHSLTGGRLRMVIIASMLLAIAVPFINEWDDRDVEDRPPDGPSRSGAQWTEPK